MTTGFFSKHLGWVGPRPKTPEELAEADRVNLAAIEAQRQRDEEARRPDQERIDDLAETILNTVDPDLVDAVRVTSKQVVEAVDRIRQTKADLAAHLTLEEGLTPEAIEPWLARLFVLERSVPILDKQAKAAAEAYTEARTALAKAAVYAGSFYRREATERQTQAGAEAKALIDAANKQAWVVNAAIGQAQAFKG